MGNYQGVIFDLDGVIVSTDECHYQAWKKLADREGIYFDRKINERLRGVSRMASLEILLERADKKYTEENKAEMAEVKNNCYRELLESLTPAAILPGVLELLKNLKEKRIQIAIGSSSKNTPFILKKIGLDKAFTAIADGNQIKNSKPDPEVFLLAARLLNLPSEKCIVVEDALAGIDAAIAAGAKPVAVGYAAGYERAAYSVEELSTLDMEEFLK